MGAVNLCSQLLYEYETSCVLSGIASPIHEVEGEALFFRAIGPAESVLVILGCRREGKANLSSVGALWVHPDFAVICGYNLGTDR